jgi:vacuolar iron transporter family protein
LIGFKLSEHLKSIVYGGMDGILTVYAVISSSMGSPIKIPVVLILSIQNIISDGLTMGLGDYVSTKTVNQFLQQERGREEWEYEHCFEGEKQEMIDIYKQKVHIFYLGNFPPRR